MKQFVQSNFERREDDNYPTIDTRCVDGLLTCLGVSDPIVDVCAKNGSAIVDYLNSSGLRKAFGVQDAFFDDFDANWIVTNTPYKRDKVDKIIYRQIERVISGKVTGFAALLRSGFDFAKSRKEMFSSSYYWGQVKLCFRPWWSDSREQEPIHSYVWHVWKGYGTDIPTIKY